MRHFGILIISSLAVLGTISWVNHQNEGLIGIVPIMLGLMFYSAFAQETHSVSGRNKWMGVAFIFGAVKMLWYLPLIDTAAITLWTITLWSIKHHGLSQDLRFTPRRWLALGAFYTLGYAAFVWLKMPAEVTDKHVVTAVDNYLLFGALTIIMMAQCHWGREIKLRTTFTFQ